MSGSTHGLRKLRSPAVKETRMPNEAVPSIEGAREGLPERRMYARAGPFLRWYYGVKYRIFRRARQPRDGRRGLIVLQVDALSYADLRRAISAGHCPTLARMLAVEGFELRRWFCGLPSATPYCQAGIFHGENRGLPPLPSYHNNARRAPTCQPTRRV